MSQEAGSKERRAPPPREMVWDLFQVLFQPSAPGLQGRHVGLVVGCGVRAGVQPSSSLHLGAACPSSFTLVSWGPIFPGSVLCPLRASEATGQVYGVGG